MIVTVRMNSYLVSHKNLLTGFLLFIAACLCMAGVMIVMGKSSTLATAIDAYEISLQAKNDWDTIISNIKAPGVENTEPNTGNPLLVDGATALDILVHGELAVNESYKPAYQKLNLHPLKDRLFVGKHKIWNSIDYRVQGIEFFKVAYSNGAFYSVFTDVPTEIVSEAVSNYEPFNTFRKDNNDQYGLVRYQKVSPHRYVLMFYFDQ